METYKRLSEDVEIQNPNKDQNTCLKFTTYLLAVLNLITALGALCLCVANGGLSSILYAFYGNSDHDGIIELVIITSAFLVVLTIGWIVMIGYFIASLVKRRPCSCSEVCCNYMLHTVAIWIIVLRAGLISIICWLNTIHEEFDFDYILYLMFIDIVMNIVFVVVYYFYAVKLNFGNPKPRKAFQSSYDG